MEIKKVAIRKDGIKYILIPKKSEIKSGDTVLIINDMELLNKFLEEEIGREKRRRKEL